LGNVALQIENLWWKYEGVETWTLQGIDYELDVGKCLGIVGATGAGKTTLLRCLNGLIPHSFNGLMKGNVRVLGNDTGEKKVFDIAMSVGTVFEDAEAQFVATTLEEDVAFGLENLALPREEMRRRIDWSLGIVGLSGFERRNAHELSGGQKQRAALASILAMRPRVLLLDEPSAELDPLGKSEVFEIIKSLKEDQKMTIVLVEQDTEEMMPIVDELILLQSGKIALRGEATSFFARTRELREAGVRPLDAAIILSDLGVQASEFSVESVSANIANKMKRDRGDK